MSVETEDPEAAAGRLEAALERIARLAARGTPAIASVPSAEVAARLDAIIARLRAALGGKP